MSSDASQPRHASRWQISFWILLPIVTITVVGVLWWIVSVGLRELRKQRTYDLVVQSLEDRIESRVDELESVEDSELPPDELRRRKEFLELAITSDRALLALLKSQGPEAYRRPLVGFGEISPHPIPESERKSDAKPYNHLLYVEWLEPGTQVTGFYFEMDDGTIHEFKDSIDASSAHFAKLEKLGPSRYDIIGLSRTTNDPKRSLVHMSSELHAKVIDEKRVKGVGLIHEDGKRTKPAPVGYPEILR